MGVVVVVAAAAAVDQGVMGEVVELVLGGVVLGLVLEVCVSSLDVPVILEVGFEKKSSGQLVGKMVPLCGILKQAILVGRGRGLQVHDTNMRWCNQAGYMSIPRIDETHGTVVESNRICDRMPDQMQDPGERWKTQMFGYLRGNGCVSSHSSFQALNSSSR